MRRWAELQSYGEMLTCYSAAMSTWLAADRDDWAATIDPGLWLTVTDEGDGLLGFSYFPPGLRGRLGLVRAGADAPPAALDGVLSELARSGRVIVAGDGYHLPWHVANGREHVPHWFTVTGSADAPAIADPFACRNELGTQVPVRRIIDAEQLRGMLPALPAGHPVHRQREELAFGERFTAGLQHRHQWFVRGPGAQGGRTPIGLHGPAAVRALAAHFRERGQDLAAYAQADDVWSIARHRAFAVAHAQERPDAAWTEWVTGHGFPLARRWSHVAPLLMQAVLSLRAGRAASGSVADTLDELADREAAAGQALPGPGPRITIGADRLGPVQAGSPGQDRQRGPRV